MSMLHNLLLFLLLAKTYSELPALRGTTKRHVGDGNKNNEGEALNDWPIIGIFTQPTSDSISPCNGDCQYIAASYVKYIESAGARVVPINYYSTNDELDKLLNSLNGVLFPGGGANFPDSVQYVYDQIKLKNDQGDFMPLWGTCMGFQWLLISQTKDINILDPNDGTQMDAENYSIPLDFTKNAIDSHLFGIKSTPIALLEVLSSSNVTMNNHHYGIWTSHFYETDELNSFFNVISTNKDRNNNEFISTIEAKEYPIWGTQWHPEKNDFEWKKDIDGTPREAINHTPPAIAVAHYTADYFINQARRNKHTFSNVEDEEAALIYNYQPTKTGANSAFLQKYYFPTGAW